VLPSQTQLNEDDWDTTKIGFITKLDPNFYNPDQAHMKFTDYLKEQIKKTQGRTKIKIPQFRMVFSSPRIRNDQKSNDFYQSICNRSEAERL
jgi:hypothetical protein